MGVRVIVFLTERFLHLVLTKRMNVENQRPVTVNFRTLVAMLVCLLATIGCDENPQQDILADASGLADGVPVQQDASPAVVMMPDAE